MSSKEIEFISDENWEYIESVEDPPYEITGKYLFFSTNRETLKEIAVQEISKHGFHAAKIPVEGGNIGSEYVLCLYYENQDRKHELAERYRDRTDVNYRWWKSDEDTLSGKYSDRFINDFNKEFGD